MGYCRQSGKSQSRSSCAQALADDLDPSFHAVSKPGVPLAYWWLRGLTAAGRGLPSTVERSFRGCLHDHRGSGETGKFPERRKNEVGGGAVPMVPASLNGEGRLRTCHYAVVTFVPTRSAEIPAFAANWACTNIRRGCPFSTTPTRRAGHGRRRYSFLEGVGPLADYASCCSWFWLILQAQGFVTGLSRIG